VAILLLDGRHATKTALSELSTKRGTMTVEAWLLFCLIETLLCIKPGPCVMVICSLAMHRGQRAGIIAAGGVIVANVLYFAVAASGLMTIHALSIEAFTVIKWGGAIYLLWLGARAILRSFRSNDDADMDANAPRGSPFFKGLVVQGANTNLLVYFGAILPQFIDPELAVAQQVAILAVSSIVIEFAVLAAYSWLSSEVARRAAPRFRLYLDRVGGALLIAAAAGVARLNRE
jgi:homoserine/homoserine lactone efflux protein